jgi:hypothetical protein
MAMLDRTEAEALEVLIDERLESVRHALPGEALEGLRGAAESPERAGELLAPWRAGRHIEWAAQTVVQGEVLAAFADHCEGELEDVEVLERRDDLLVARWRRETSRLELRAGFAGLEHLASSTPTVLLGDIESDEERILQAFLDDADLRSRLAICDLGRLERIGAVRSSIFVYLEWFLRDAYGVKLQPSPRFTQGLIDRGVISLGMG